MNEDWGCQADKWPKITIKVSWKWSSFHSELFNYSVDPFHKTSLNDSFTKKTDLVLTDSMKQYCMSSDYIKYGILVIWTTFNIFLWCFCILFEAWQPYFSFSFIIFAPFLILSPQYCSKIHLLCFMKERKSCRFGNKWQDFDVWGEQLL